MKKILRLSVFVGLLSLISFQSSCSEPEPETEPDTIIKSTTGDATFWLASDLGVGNITVTLNDVSKIITGYYTSTPSCGADSSANFSLSPGTYTYNASAGNTIWKGTIIITSGECSKMQLTRSGENGGSGSGNGVLNGKWMSSDGTGITISGTQAIFYSFNPAFQTAAKSGYVSIGNAKLKDIVSLKVSQWSCRELYLTSTNGIIDGVKWSNDGTLSLNSNNNVLTLTSTGPVSGNKNVTVYTKQL